MTSEEKNKNIWSRVVLSLIGVVCLFYIMYKREFAKVHLEFSFFKFPVFVGEMLLFVCLILLACYLIKYRPQRHYANALIATYLVWFLFKLLTGYHRWGPLALRHAALYYYSIFFIIGFIFFKKDIFTKNVLLLLCTVIIGIFAWRHFDRYWTVTLVCLGFILILMIREKKWMIFLSLALTIVIPYIALFQTARMMFVANMASLILIMAGIIYLLEARVSIKIGILTFLFVGTCFGFYKFFVLGESGRTFASPHEVREAFQEMDALVRQKEESYKMDSVSQVGLYHPSDPEPEFYYHVNLLKGKKKVKAYIEKNNVQKLVFFDYGSLTNTDGNSPALVPNGKQTSLKGLSTNNIVFRFFIWRDMYRDWSVHKPLMGVDFGKPFLSPSLVVLNWATQEWGRDGWIEPHNSYFNILYRAGIVGIILVVIMWGALIWLIRTAFERRSWTLILLSAILLGWMVAANFLLILELPYTAIPFWTLAGMTFAYACKDTNHPKEVYEIKR